MDEHDRDFRHSDDPEGMTEEETILKARTDHALHRCRQIIEEELGEDITFSIAMSPHKGPDGFSPPRWANVVAGGYLLAIAVHTGHLAESIISNGVPEHIVLGMIKSVISQAQAQQNPMDTLANMLGIDLEKNPQQMLGHMLKFPGMDPLGEVKRGTKDGPEATKAMEDLLANLDNPPFENQGEQP